MKIYFSGIIKGKVINLLDYAAAIAPWYCLIIQFKSYPYRLP